MGLRYIALAFSLVLVGCGGETVGGAPPPAPRPNPMADATPGPSRDAAIAPDGSVVEPGVPCRITDDVFFGRATHTAAIGTADRLTDAFSPWSNDDVINYEWGYQGGAMVTPSLRIQGATGDSDGVCVRVLVRNEFVAPLETDEPGIVRDLVFYPRGDHLQTGALWNLVAYEPPDGRAVDLTIDLRSTELAAQHVLRIRLGDATNERTPRH